MFTPHFPGIHTVCPCCLPRLLAHAACLCCMSVLHVRAACPCCMSVLHVRAACPCYMSLLSCPFYMSMLHVHPDVHAACPYCMSVRHVCAVCPRCMSILHVQGTFQNNMSKLHPCSFSMMHVRENVNLHVHAACQRGMSTPYICAACLCCMFILYVNAA
jgi:hypothetical protein